MQVKKILCLVALLGCLTSPAVNAETGSLLGTYGLKAWELAKEIFPPIEPAAKAMIDNPINTSAKCLLGGLAAYYGLKAIQRTFDWVKDRESNFGNLSAQLVATALSLYIAKNIGGPAFKDSASLTLLVTAVTPALTALIKSQLFHITDSIDPFTEAKLQSVRAEVNNNLQSKTRSISDWAIPGSIQNLINWTTHDALKTFETWISPRDLTIEELQAMHNEPELQAYIASLSNGDITPCLLLGNSGTGKTQFLKDLANALNKSMTWVNGTTLFGTEGYKGVAVQKLVFFKNYLKSLMDMGTLKQGDIIGMDEVDKLILNLSGEQAANAPDSNIEENKGIMEIQEACASMGLILVTITNLPREAITKTIIDRFTRIMEGPAGTKTKPGVAVEKRLPDGTAREAIIRRIFKQDHTIINVNSFAAEFAEATDQMTPSGIAAACSKLRERWIEAQKVHKGLGVFDTQSSNEETKLLSQQILTEVLSICAQKSISELEVAYKKMEMGIQNQHETETKNGRTVNRRVTPNNADPREPKLTQEELNLFRAKQEGELHKLQDSIKKIRIADDKRQEELFNNYLTKLQKERPRPETIKNLETQLNTWITGRTAFWEQKHKKSQLDLKTAESNEIKFAGERSREAHIETIKYGNLFKAKDLMQLSQEVTKLQAEILNESEKDKRCKDIINKLKNSQLITDEEIKWYSQLPYLQNLIEQKALESLKNSGICNETVAKQYLQDPQLQVISEKVSELDKELRKMRSLRNAWQEIEMRQKQFIKENSKQIKKAASTATFLKYQIEALGKPNNIQRETITHITNLNTKQSTYTSKDAVLLLTKGEISWLNKLRNELIKQQMIKDGIVLNGTKAIDPKDIDTTSTDFKNKAALYKNKISAVALQHAVVSALAHNKETVNHCMALKSLNKKIIDACDLKDETIRYRPQEQQGLELPDYTY
ncbi:MAG: AAA family ATPase [Candidatus Babeliaceae bacterium]|nr:AAA family ATPase [Candidatus Babeliaceae bacterium]